MNATDIRNTMAESDQRRIEYTDKEGVTRTGFVDTYESEYDNDECDECSLCFAGDDGEMLIVWEHDIENIRILNE